MTIRRLGVAAAAAVATLLAGAQGARALKPEDFLAWLEQNRQATPAFQPGDKITSADAEKIRPFIMPGHIDELIFDDMEMTIKPHSDLTPADVYKEATAKYQAQVVIAQDGAIENYVAGEPFDETKLTTEDPQAGFKAIWNFNFRWVHEGLDIGNVGWVWVRRGGSHDGHPVLGHRFGKAFGGGGSFERALWGPYQRVYFSNRADLPDQDYQVEGSWARGTEFRELTEFNEPFDIRGTAFLILRYSNPRKSDDAWAYIPSLRRVRRISVEVKSDSLLGTDHTLEDFYCFSGRPLEHDWKYHGTAKMLAIARSRNAMTMYHGPNGWTPHDDWELREVDVIEQIPKLSNHPYSRKFLFTDREHHDCYAAASFDRAGELWKVWQLSKSWTEDPWYSGKEKTPPGTRVSSFQSINVIDKQNDRGTLVPCPDSQYPDNSVALVQRKMDVNQLSEGR
jgi:hypothetical protein